MDSVLYVFTIVLLFVLSIIFYSQLLFIEGFILQMIAILRIAYPFIKEI